MAGRLEDRVAIVTGAGSSGPGWGNGKATAVLFSREGAKVFAVDINSNAVDETKGIIEGEGGECAVMSVDVSKQDEVKAMVEECMKTFGRIDILHNNVGIGIVGGAVDMSEEDWDRVISINLTSMFLTCKYVLPHMEDQGKGSIVNVSSLAGIRWLGVPYISYSASKAGVNQFTKSVALEYAKKNIRVNCIVPGLLNTPLIVGSLTKAYGGDVQEMIEIRDGQCPMGKMGDAWDTAHAALFLASDEAKYITGIELIVDGGMSCKCD